MYGAEGSIYSNGTRKPQHDPEFYNDTKRVYFDAAKQEFKKKHENADNSWDNFWSSVGQSISENIEGIGNSYRYIKKKYFD